MMKSFYCATDHLVHLSELIGRPAHWRAVAEAENTLADGMGDFLGRLRLLYGVPFKYLVPDARMLPPESIRFFHVDQNWVDALVDGANSLGRLTSLDRAHDAALAPLARELSDVRALDVRRKQLKRAPLASVEENPVYTGFLLRSAVVSGWPGLEVQAFAAREGTGQPIEMSRMDRLAPDVLLCIFPRLFQCVNLHEPKEGLAFGATPVFPHPGAADLNVDPSSYTKNLRGLGVGGYVAGDFIKDCSVTVPLRNSDSRVVAMSQYADTVKAKLLGLNPAAWKTSEPFTSAQFALEAVQGADQFLFQTELERTQPELPLVSRTDMIARRAAEDRAALNSYLFGQERL